MRRFVCLSLLVMPVLCLGRIPIVEDYTKASDIAQVYNRPLILLFTGSDWCTWSQKLLSDLIGDSRFEKEIGNSFIFVQIDYPENNRKTCTSLKQNQELKERYNIQSFPTIVIADPSGREMTRLGYMTREPEQFARHLKDLSVSYFQLHHQVKQTDFTQTEVEVVQAMYNTARDLRCPFYISKLLDAGVEADQGVYFPLEKYAHLVNQGNVDTPVAKVLRDKIKKRDPQNKEGARLRLALLDFQAYEGDPEKAIEPLGNYISDFGGVDQENLWRLHLIISEYFSDRGDGSLAKEHAKRSIEEAPESQFPMLQKVLESVK